jgi:two-component system cell cycle response regulator DivK
VTAAPPDATRGERGDGAPPFVLIVDDSEKNLKLARDVLRAAGFRTLEAASGADGLALATEHLPDVVLLDLELSDMLGTDAARQLAAGTRTAHIPVVAVTAHRLDGADGWLRAAGFAGYLEKPINVREFPDQVRRYCLGGGGR